MAEATATRPLENYLDDFEKRQENGQAAWLKEVRNQGKLALEKATFPHGKMEEWRHTNINALTNTFFKVAPATPEGSVTADTLKDLSLAAAGMTELVFVDGRFSESLSTIPALPEGVVVGSLHGQQENEFLKAQTNHIQQNRNAFTALNTAFLRDGAVVYVPRKAVLESPIHLLFVSTAGADEAAAHIRNVIALEESSEATICATYAGLDGATKYLNNIVEEIALGPNAQLKHYKAVQEGAAGNHLATSEVRQDRDSKYFSLAISQEGKITRNQTCVTLVGEGSECALHGLYLNDQDRLVDNAINIHHTVPHCNSRIAYKGILDDKSKSVFTGKVNVDQLAQQTDSDQLSNNLLLSDSATIDSKPQLEIYADDVKCTHGATVGAHPEEIIFYFRSRGIDEPTARGMLTFGFACEVIDEIEVDALRDRLADYVFEKYSPK